MKFSHFDQIILQPRLQFLQDFSEFTCHLDAIRLEHRFTQLGPVGTNVIQIHTMLL